MSPTERGTRVLARSGESSPVSTRRASGLWKRKLLVPLHHTFQKQDVGCPAIRYAAFPAQEREVVLAEV
ncbi:MAG TPA: hypothetical protein VFC37_01615 [Terracidiphilus sp.]|nr:hypothetical protein [Terracidiphilus sp.]